MKKAKIASLVLATTVIQSTVVSAMPNEENKNKEDLSKVKGTEESIKASRAAVINNIPIKKMLIDINYSKGVTINPKYIVIHDTDNRSFGAGAIANRNYFANHPNANASAHFIVDDKNIVQALEETWKGWHIGDRYSGVTPNRPEANNGNTIGIEIAVNPDSNFDVAMKNSIELVKHLMFKYNIPAENVITHNDATGKICPRMMLKDRPSLWPTFKSAIKSGDTNTNNPSNNIGSGSLGAIKDVDATVSTNYREDVYRDMNTSGSTVGVVYSKEKVRVNYFKDDWANITFQSSAGGTRTGFIYASKLNVSGLSYVNKKATIKNDKAVTVYKDFQGTAIENINPNVAVTLNYNFNEWSNITYVSKDSSLKQGFVNKSLVKISDSDGDRGEEGTVITVNKDGRIINTNSAKVYLREDENSDGIGFLYKNDVVRVNFTKGLWANVTFTMSDGSKRTGYIKNEYVSVGSDSNEDSNKPMGKGQVVNVSSNLRVRKGPGTSYEAVGWLNNNDVIDILGKEGQWFKISGKGIEGYCHGDYIKEIREDNTEVVQPDKDTATNKGQVINVTSNLRIRETPSTSSNVLGVMNNNTTFEIIKKEGDWYNISYNNIKGYIHGDYVKEIGKEDGKPEDNNTNPPSENKPAEDSTLKGQVINVTSNLRIRENPSTNGQILGYINNNATFDIIKKEGSWYYISYNNVKGYVHGDYVKEIGKGDSSNPTPPSNETKPTENKAGKGQVVNVTSGLRMRAGSGTNYDVVGWLYNGDNFEILGKQGQWYKVKHKETTGYVHGDYVKVLEENSGGSNNNTTPSTPETPKESVGNVINAPNGLRVRQGAGTSYSVVGWLSNGDQVKVLGKEGQWYKIDNKGTQGYIHGDYLRLKEDSDSSQGSNNSGNSSVENMQKKGKIVNVTTALRVRKAPSTDSEVMGTIYGGTIVDIVGKEDKWYKIKYNGQEAFVHGDYVQEVKVDVDQGEDNSGSITIKKKGKVVNVTYSLRVRENPSLDGLVVGYMAPNDTFDIIDKKGDWYKISFNTYSDKKQGYVHKDYVKEFDDVVTESNVGKEMAQYAKKFLGVEYVWGGTTPKGFDCSGLVQYVYKNFGVSIGRTTWDQIKQGQRVPLSDLKEGDLIFFGEYSNPTNPTHVGMYIGNNEFIHASYGSKVVKISNVNTFGMAKIQANRYIK